MSNYTIDRQIMIHENESGSRIVVGPDNDGLDLVSITYYNNNNTPLDSILVNKEEAILIAKSILELYGDKV